MQILINVSEIHFSIVFQKIEKKNQKSKFQKNLSIIIFILKTVVNPSIFGLKFFFITFIRKVLSEFEKCIQGL